MNVSDHAECLFDCSVMHGVLLDFVWSPSRCLLLDLLDDLFLVLPFTVELLLEDELELLLEDEWEPGPRFGRDTLALALTFGRPSRDTLALALTSGLAPSPSELELDVLKLLLEEVLKLVLKDEDVLKLVLTDSELTTGASSGLEYLKTVLPFRVWTCLAFPKGKLAEKFLFKPVM